MARGTGITDKTRDLILVQSVVYRKTLSQISTETGVSVGAVSKTISCYEAIKAEKWDTIAAKCNSKEYNATTLLWAEKAAQKKIPQDVWDICFPKEKEDVGNPPPEMPKATDSALEQLVKIHAVLQAIEADLPQILTALTYLSKTFKEVVNANADPMLQMLKTANENLVGIKCNTRALRNTEGK